MVHEAYFGHRYSKLKPSSQYDEWWLSEQFGPSCHRLGDSDAPPVTKWLCRFPDEVHALLKALVLFGLDPQARRLQQDYGEVLLLLESSIPAVWPEDLQQSSAPVSPPHPIST